MQSQRKSNARVTLNQYINYYENKPKTLKGSGIYIYLIYIYFDIFVCAVMATALNFELFTFLIILSFCNLARVRFWTSGSSKDAWTFSESLLVASKPFSRSLELVVHLRMPGPLARVFWWQVIHFQDLLSHFLLTTLLFNVVTRGRT